MASPDSFDEQLLFTEFDELQVKKKKKENFTECTGGKSARFLREENSRLKKALRSLVSIFKGRCWRQEGVSEKEASCPLFQVVYFDNRASIRNREKVEEFVQSLTNDCIKSGDERESIGNFDLTPSVFELNYELQKRDEERDCSSLTTSVINSVQYYDEFCVDCTGYPLVDFNPRLTDGWNIPKYEQVFFKVLPCSDETPKVRLQQGRTCFNCEKQGHSLQECPEPHDFARINANRKEFLNKFSSPVNSKSSRYHFENSQENRFVGFKAGIISENLKKALGLGEQDLPLYIYRMRALGYPPGYLPHLSQPKPSLTLYGADGNADDYMVENGGDKHSDSIRNSLVEYPGFNTPPPEGVRDISAELGLPPMGRHQHIDNIATIYRQMHGLPEPTTSQQNQKKRKTPDTGQDEEDMDIVEDGGSTSLVELTTSGPLHNAAQTKRRRYEDASDSSDGDRTGYSPAHPGVQCGKEEIALLKHYKKLSASDLSDRFVPDTDLQPKDITSDMSRSDSGFTKRTSSSRESLEEGEVVSDEEEEHDDENAEEDDFPAMTAGWWLGDPLQPVSSTQPKLSPPPRPTVVLPLEALSRFYTNSTVLQKLSFEDRIMWLDPIYGNIQLASGRYEKLKKILGKNPARK